MKGWVYSRDAAAAAAYTSIFRQGPSGANPQVVVELLHRGALSISRWNPAAAPASRTWYFTSLPLNEWHHFAMVVDRGTLSSSAGDQWLRAYLDGVEVASRDNSSIWAAKKINAVAAAEPAMLGCKLQRRPVTAVRRDDR